MSRIGKIQRQLPQGVTAVLTDGRLHVQGPRGQLEMLLHPAVSVAVVDGTVRVSVNDPDDKKQRALWGLFGSLIGNMIEGVTRGFEKKLEVQGVGYKVALQGNVVRLDVGFSHPVLFTLPEGVQAAVEKNTITLTGIDKQMVGEAAAQIRKIRKPEPYKGKGIRYVGEQVRRKAGKATTKGA